MEKYIWFEKQKNYEMRIEKSISLKLRGKSKKIGESVEGRRRFAEAHEPRRADAPRVRADENTRA